MTQDEIDTMWQKAMHQSIKEGEMFTRYQFAHLVADKATEEANARANASWTLMCKKMVAIEREALAQPEQEPVAYLCEPDENGLYGLPLTEKTCTKCFPVYRHTQRTWVGLTDEEKSELWEISRAALPRYATYASLVEAKLKEKNT